MFLKPGILLRALSHNANNLRPKIFVTKTPVIRITNITISIPEPGIDVSIFNKASGRNLAGTRLFTTSKKNLITRTLKAKGIQNKSPDMK